MVDFLVNELSVPTHDILMIMDVSATIAGTTVVPAIL